uniref:NADH-ubiquinone oxidoreductase chain 2 n=1 Tax=Riccardoella tokyoensis TaxID=2073164 RepID=A0A7R7UNG2_9ACAR|nr:NADH dehydrogenase subunit 2 [Riccardoella tokyoensis]
MKFYNFFILNFMLLSPLMMMSSNSFMMMWIMLEINSMSFIFLSSTEKSNKIKKENFIFMYIIQSISSMMIIIYIMNTNNLQLSMNNSSSMILLTALLMKMNMFPFHKWSIIIMKIMSLKNFMIYSSWQKIAPIFLLMKFNNLSMMMIMLMINAMIMTMLQFNMKMMKMLLIYSSMIHSSWMLMPIKFNSMNSMMYLIIYSMILMTLIMAMKKMNMWIFSMYFNNSFFTMMVMILSLAGIPPLTGFLLKWIMFNSLIEFYNNPMMLTTIMITLTMNFYIYSKFIFMNMFLIMNNMITNMNMHKNMYSYLTNLIMPMIFIAM